MRTYAILDAARMPYLLTGRIEASALQYRSLFQGEAQEDLGEHAPYLVELKDGNAFIQDLFTGADGVNGLWGAELGIYVRSRADFVEIRKHFRKFTRLQDKQGKWFYFRFWEGAFIQAFADLHLSLEEETVHFMCQFLGKNQIWALDFLENKATAYKVNEHFHRLTAPNHKHLPRQEINRIFAFAKIRENKKKILRDLSKIINQFENSEVASLSRLVDAVVDRAMKHYNIKNISNLKKLCIWSHFLGFGFEHKTDFSYVSNALNRKGAESRKFQNIEIWMTRWEREQATKRHQT